MSTVIERRSTFSEDCRGQTPGEVLLRLQVHACHLDTLLHVGSDSLAAEWADDSASPACPRWEGVCRLSSELWETTLLLSSTSSHSLVWSVSGTRLRLLNSLPYVLLIPFPRLLTTALPLSSSCLLGPHMIDLCVFPDPGGTVRSSWSGFVPHS